MKVCIFLLSIWLLASTNAQSTTSGATSGATSSATEEGATQGIVMSTFSSTRIQNPTFSPTQSPTPSPTQIPTYSPTTIEAQKGIEHVTCESSLCAEGSGRCWDYKDWRSSAGQNCATYTENNLCTIEGKEGEGWTDWLKIQDYATGGNHAFLACCECGGGIPEFSPVPEDTGGLSTEIIIAIVVLSFCLLLFCLGLRKYLSKDRTEYASPASGGDGVNMSAVNTTEYDEA